MYQSDKGLYDAIKSECSISYLLYGAANYQRKRKQSQKPATWLQIQGFMKEYEDQFPHLF